MEEPWDDFWFEAPEFPPRKQIEGDVMEALRVGNPSVLGIWGMAGLGKTALVEKLMERVKKEKLFNEVVMVTVGQDIDIYKIQEHMSNWLGLDLKATDLRFRAHKLCCKLTNDNVNRILLILDDVWGKLELRDLGIPCESGIKGCTVLIASRSLDVLNRMNAKAFTLEFLSKEEAWDLFRDKAGTCIDDPNLHSVAEQVVKECKGLPIALVALGSTLKDKNDKAIWNDTLRKLKGSDLENIYEIYEEICIPLRLSYKHLNSRQAKDLFLLCGQFPKDYDIDVNDLTMYCMALSLFGEIGHVKETRDRVSTLIDMLKSCSMLLGYPNKNFVKMHPLVRDLAIGIAFEEGLANRNPNSLAVSKWKWKFLLPKTQNELLDPLVGSSHLSLNHLIIRSSFNYQSLSTENVPFELKSLSLRNTSFNLAPPIKFLKNLRTLYLVNCHLKDISIVDQLLELEILVCQNDETINELPPEIRRLEHLKLLDFGGCHNLEKIAPGIISSLVELEELKLLESFKNWESKNVSKHERSNASLVELKKLKKLNLLWIEIKCSWLGKELIDLLSSIESYRIIIGDHDSERHELAEITVEKVLWIERGIFRGKWIQRLVSTAEALRLEGDSSTCFDLSLLRDSNIRQLKIAKYKSIKVGRGRDIFLHLEKLKLGLCNEMVKVFYGNTIENGVYTPSIGFPKLKHLKLFRLSSLTTFYKGIEYFEFPSLHKLEISACYELSGFITSVGSELNPSDDVSPLFNNKKIAFGSLKELNVNICHSIKSLWSSPSSDLVNIEHLKIEYCHGMDTVIGNEVFLETSHGVPNVGNRESNHLTFKKLKTLNLQGLKHLKTFSSGVKSIDFPVLVELSISYCPNLTSFVSSSRCYQNQEANHLFCSPEVTFSSRLNLTLRGHDHRSLWCRQISPCFFERLTYLCISNCHKIKALFEFSIVKNLVNLKDLAIGSCEQMEKVIADDMKITHATQIIFPSLVSLTLSDLLLLKYFCKRNSALSLPLLYSISIHNCPKMELFSSESLRIPRLKEVKLDGRVFIEKSKNADSLNEIIRQRKGYSFNEWVRKNTNEDLEEDTREDEENNEKSTSSANELEENASEDGEDNMSALNVGNAPNVANSGQEFQSSAPVVPTHPQIITPPFFPSVQTSASLSTSTPVLPLLENTESNAAANWSTDLVEQWSSFCAPPPSSAPHIMPPITSSVPTAPPLNAPGNIQRPFGAPLHQPLPHLTPPLSLTPTSAPTPHYGPVTIRDEVREAPQALVQILTSPANELEDTREDREDDASALNVGNAPNVANSRQAFQSSTPVVPTHPWIVTPPVLSSVQASASLSTSTPILSPLKNTESNAVANRSTDLVEPWSPFFAPSPTSTPYIMPPITSSVPTAPPRNAPGNIRRPYGAPSLQPLPHPTPPLSLTPTSAPTPHYEPIIIRDEVREAHQALVQRLTSPANELEEDDASMVCGAPGSSHVNELESIHTLVSKEEIMRMKFDTVEAAYEFYLAYAKRVGFRVRKSKFHKENRKIIDRIFCCSAEGEREVDKRVGKTHRPETRFKCLAHLKISCRKREKYEVVKFESEHSHPLSCPDESQLEKASKKRKSRNENQ